MFALRISRVGSLVLGTLIALASPVLACQSGIDVPADNSASKTGISSRRLSDSHDKSFDESEASTRRSLSDRSERKLTDNLRNLSDSNTATPSMATPSAATPSTLRKLSDTQEQIGSATRTISDMAQDEFPSQQIATLDSKQISTRRVLSDNQKPTVQLALTAQPDPPRLNAPVTQKRSLTDSNGSASDASLKQFGQSSNVAAISSRVIHNRDSIAQTTYGSPDPQDPGEQGVASAPTMAVAATPQNGQVFRNLTGSKEEILDSKPNLVDPEMFRVRPETGNSPISRNISSDKMQFSTPNAGSATIPNGRRLQNASTRRNPNWHSLNQDEGVELPPLDNSVVESTKPGIVRNIGDADDTDEVRDRIDPTELGKLNAGESATFSLPPVGDLGQGLGYQPLTQAYGPSSLGDPYLASRVYAPAYNQGATQQTKTWRSPNLKHRPLYFEDAPLERHGQSVPKIQPYVSGARFFSSVVLLPQKILATPPRECVHPVGYGRPGDCTPKVRETLPRRGE